MTNPFPKSIFGFPRAKPPERNPRVSIVGPPADNFNPELLRAKRVMKFNFCQDVRAIETPGEMALAWRVEGAPVLWLTAADGTEVVLFQEDLIRLREATIFFSPKAEGHE